VKPESDVTQLLQQLNDGDTSAKERLAPLIYDELHKLARRHMARESADNTWQPTALIHEVFIQLTEQSTSSWEGQRHFLSVASRGMRNILVDHARARARRPRQESGDETILDGALRTYADRGLDILALHEALAELGERDAELVDIVEMRFFAGLGFAEIAAVHGVTERTIYRRWCLAKAWLRGVLDE
jgi:RNA polymerase sigma factor (TIGR02999 family)